MMQRNVGVVEATRRAYLALQAGDFATARDSSAPWLADASCALLHALGRAGAGDVEGGAAALAAIARENPTAQHPALDLATMLAGVGQDPAPHLQAALRHAPDNAFLLSALGGVLVQAGLMEGALEAFTAAARAQPESAGTWSNLGKTLAAMGRYTEADVPFERAATLAPGHAQMGLNRAIATLRSGRLADGWPLFRARHGLAGRPPAPPGPELRALDGVAGQTVLLVHQEGFGDTLQFIRYAPLLAGLGARVLAVVPAELNRLLRGSGIEVVTEAPHYDTWCYIPDLPGVFGTTLETIPATLPYLWADPALVAQWAPRAPPGCSAALVPDRRIGLVWAGAARLHDPSAVATDRLRSVTADRLGPLLATPDVRWVSLQQGTVAPSGLFNPMPGVTDFADTAAIVAGLDAVVSVDTAVAHLAAAMGKPVLLLDRYDNCWRWLHSREDSPWYPGIVRILRQTTPGDWTDVLQRAAALLVQGFPP